MDTIYNVSDTEPPVPGGNGVINAGINWDASIDDYTNTNKLEYMVVSHDENRISDAESALRNGIVRMNWTKNVTNFGGTTGIFTTVLVRDEAGNISSYKVRN